ncbi:MAG: DeoR/GlpR transcriptional regulator, partial [Clostridia bacterium]|nr:DeoR/GlpR transcriptional regulator [Clostridia bacterium]
GSKIADEAINFVSDGYTIFLDSSEISCCFIPLLQAFDDITVITPNIKAITLISKYPAIRTICVCGCVQNELLSVSGSYAVDFIDNFNADLAVVCGSGFDINTGLSDVSMHEAIIKKKMISRAKKRVIVCPSERIGTVSPYIICNCRGFDTLITDKKLSPEKAEALMTERINFRCV